MHRIAAISTFTLMTLTLLTIGSSAIALADEPPTREQKKKDKDADKNADKSSGCSVAAEDNAVIGLAAGVLLLSGVALRRRS